MAANEPLFGFNLQQKKSLINFLQAAGVLAADGASGVISGLQIELEDATDDIAALAAWGTALATKLNAQFTVANAESTLPFSPALAVDYDTTPLA